MLMAMSQALAVPVWFVAAVMANAIAVAAAAYRYTRSSGEGCIGKGDHAIGGVCTLVRVSVVTACANGVAWLRIRVHAYVCMHL